MFTVSRFIKLSLNRNSIKRIINSNKGEFMKVRVNNFGAKVNAGSDKDVDKSKRSVSGSTTSDTERREPSQQTMKVKAQQATETVATKQVKTEENKATTTPVEPTTPSVKVIKSIPGNRPPSIEDTIPGRYANTLFAVASEEGNLYNVYEDMKYVNNLYQNLESFRLFADNSGLNASQIYSFSEELARVGEFCNTTLKFCDLLGKNKRFMYINDIAKKYIRSYLLLTKEEKITIISSQELTPLEKDQVKHALLSNPENEGKTFIIDYSVNPTILGGLQMYTENRFMDLSLVSRLDKIKDEVNKLI